MPKVLGIDSGATGALALLSANGSLLECHDMPFIKDFHVKHVDVFKLYDLLLKMRPEHIYLEEVRGIRGKSTMQTAFVQGGHYIALAPAICRYMVSNDCTFTLVSPQNWKKALNVQGGAKGQKKDKTIELVKSIYSEQADMYTGVRGGVKDGRTDAIGIALYGLKDLRKKGGL